MANALVYPNNSQYYYYPNVPNTNSNGSGNPNVTQIQMPHVQQHFKMVNSSPPQYVPIHSIQPNQHYMDSSPSPSIYYPSTAPGGGQAMPIKRLFTDESNFYHDEYTVVNGSNYHNGSSANSSSYSPSFPETQMEDLKMKGKRSIQDLYYDESGYLDRDENDMTDGDQEYDDDGNLTDDEDQELRNILHPFVNTVLRSKLTIQILPLISEYTKDEISFKDFILKMKDVRNDKLYLQLIQLLVRIDGDVRMVKYLNDNGAEEGDLDCVKDMPLNSSMNPNSASKRKRERSRKSSSKGLRSPPNKWSKDESQTLIKLVNEIGDKQWKKIASKLGGGKTGAQCAQHWKRVLSPEIKKGSWDEAEEELLFQLVDKHGQSWKNVAIEIKTRTDIQCRYQYFKAIMSRQTDWSKTEDEILTKKVKSLISVDGKISFQQVAKHLAKAKTTKIPRTSLECKLRWNQLQQSPSSSASTSPTQFLPHPSSSNSSSTTSSPPIQELKVLPMHHQPHLLNELAQPHPYYYTYSN